MSANKSTPHPHGTNKPHPHAESMLLYAQDAMETDKPWERWEVKHADRESWLNVGGHPAWKPDYDYRRKPQTILVNGIEVPEPVREELEDWQRHWIVDITQDDLVQLQQWTNGHLDARFLKRGLIHLTEENARKHAEALLSFTRK